MSLTGICTMTHRIVGHGSTHSILPQALQCICFFRLPVASQSISCKQDFTSHGTINPGCGAGVDNLIPYFSNPVNTPAEGWPSSSSALIFQILAAFCLSEWLCALASYCIGITSQPLQVFRSKHSSLVRACSLLSRIIPPTLYATTLAESYTTRIINKES